MNLGKNVNRFVMQSLNNTDFACDKCSGSFKYEMRKKHWESCSVTLKCQIANCHAVETTFTSYDLIETHWREQCNVIDLKCSVCEDMVKRPVIQVHRCDVTLINNMKLLKKRVMELEAENANLKAAAQVRPIKAAKNVPTTNKRCVANHPMSFKHAPFPRIVGGVQQAGRNLHCDLCRNPVQPTIGFFRCDSNNCDYDICVRCGMNPS